MPASGVIFNGNSVKTLKSKININDVGAIEIGSVDPSAVPTDGIPGAMYVYDTSGICYRKTTDDGTSITWEPMVPNQGPSSLYNLALTTSLVSGYFIIHFAPNDGVSPPAAGPAFVSFRWPTADVGNYALVNADTGAALFIPPGATLGMAADTMAYLYVYAVNNAGTVVVGVSRMFFDPGTLIDTVAIDASSFSNSAMYTTDALTGVAVVLVHRIALTLAVPGTWDAAPSEISPANQLLSIPKIVARYGTAESIIIAPSVNQVIAFDTLFNDFYQTVTSGVGTFWVFTAPKAGCYRMWSKLTINNATWISPNSIVFSALKNGSSEAYLQQFQWGFTTDAVFSPEGSVTVQLAKDDTLSIAFYHDRSGGNVTTQDSALSCYVCIEEV